MGYLFNPSTDIEKLKELDQFKVTIREIDAILKYIILTYDPDSELRKTHTDFIKRKREAAKRSGLSTTRTGELSDYSKDVLVGSIHEVNGMIISYLKLFNNPWLLQYNAHWNLLSQEMADSNDLGKRTPQERKLIRENIEKLTDSISMCEKHLFGGIDSENIRNALFADSERDEAIRLKPEHMAQDLENKTVDIGSNPFWPNIS